MIVKGKIPRFNTIGEEERALVLEALGDNLSGFLGGELRGGPLVQDLERAWEKQFKVRHAVACNSATSGLLAACVAAEVNKKDQWGYHSVVICPALTMSASAAAPAFLGADIHFLDADEASFCIERGSPMQRGPKAVIVTNLFGHPSKLIAWRRLCDEMNWILIEDSAQSPFAMEGDQYAGTVGHIGVFSLNVHKHIQCGEGGVAVTNDDALAHRIRLFINHGELAADFPGVGLNLRMTEVTAAIALAQLDKGPEIIAGRVKQAEKIMTAISSAVGSSSGLILPMTRPGCKHVYYAIAMRVTNGERERIVRELNAEGVPIKAGYLPLTRIPAFKQFATPCPVAERLHDHELMLFENCTYSPTDEQIEQIGEAFRKVMT